MKPIYIYINTHIHIYKKDIEKKTERETEREKRIWLNINNW